MQLQIVKTYRLTYKVYRIEFLKVRLYLQGRNQNRRQLTEGVKTTGSNRLKFGLSIY